MTDQTGQAPSGAALHALFWRVHFWAGLVTAPIVVFAALTGLLYVFTPQIEARRHASVDRVPAAGQPRPLDGQVDAARAAHPAGPLRIVVPAHAAGTTTRVFFDPHAHQGAEHDHELPQGAIVYVDPYRGHVVGTLPEMARFQTWAKKLHSSGLQGDGWRWLMELGASWLVVMLATGAWLSWPKARSRGGQGWRGLVPRMGQGRRTWRDFHSLVGLAMGAVLAVVLVTGLTWAKYSGGVFRSAQESLGQGTPPFPKGLASSPAQGRTPLSWQQAYEAARRQAPAVSMQMAAPEGPRGFWKIENFDRTQPTRRFRLALDAYTGAPLSSSGWAGLPVLAKASAIGIPFHRGELGVWNQVLLGALALAVLWSVASGFVMWWKRRPRGRVAAPPLSARQLRGAPVWMWCALAVLVVALPVFGVSVVVFAMLDGVRLVWNRQRERLEQGTVS